MKFKGKEFGLTWLSKGSKKDYKTKKEEFFITNSNGTQLKYNNEKERDKDFTKAKEDFEKENAKIRTKLFMKKFGIKVKNG